VTTSGLMPRSDEFREDLGGVAEQADGERLFLPGRALDQLQRLVEALRGDVEIAGVQAHLDPGRLAFDGEHRGTGHGGGQGLRSAHAAEAAREDPAAGEMSAIVAPADLDEGLVGALHDALAADIDPGAGGHLAVHHEAELIELVEVLPEAQCGTRLELAIRTRGASRGS
jgi:hypothetical protein